MTLVIPRGQTGRPGLRGGPTGTPQRAGRGPRRHSRDPAAGASRGPAAAQPGLCGSLAWAPRRAGRGPAAAQYKRSPMATEGHRASE